MDPLLRSRLQRLNADFAALDIEPGRAVWLACDLLLDGVDTPALCELAGESPPSSGPGRRIRSLTACSKNSAFRD